jgi:hypothetical protein
VHLLQSFDNADKTEKFVKDFTVLSRVMQELYPRPELLAAAHETTFAYCPHYPNNSYIPVYNKEFPPAMAEFYRELIALDPDANQLEKINFGQERAIGFLKVLHRFEKEESKNQVVDFLNQNRGLIDQWHVNSSSPINRELMADFLLARPEFFDKVGKYFQDEEVTRESLIKSLERLVYVFNDPEIVAAMPNREKLEMQPASSELLEVLMVLNEKELPQELNQVQAAIEADAGLFNIQMLLDTEMLAQSEARSQVLAAVISAKKKLSGKKYNNLLMNLKGLVSWGKWTDPAAGVEVTLEIEQRLDKVKELFSREGIEF